MDTIIETKDKKTRIISVGNRYIVQSEHADDLIYEYGSLNKAIKQYNKFVKIGMKRGAD